jgi:putative ABC transport system substrate-binding protein
MRRLVLLILALATLLPSLAEAYDVLILQSRRDAGYDEVLKGFRSGTNMSQRLVVLADYAEIDVVRIVREDRPALILAVGDAALSAARVVQQVPILSVMALGIHTTKPLRGNISGISLFVAPDRYMEMFNGMKIRRVGVIYNPANSGWYLDKARENARQAGIELLLHEVATPREALAKLSTLAGKVDALWVLPDMTAVTRETTEAYFRFGQEHAVPVVAFASSYIGLGAVAAVDIDRFELGHQAQGMAMAILQGETVDATPRFPQRTSTKTNQVVLKRLGRAP